MQITNEHYQMIIAGLRALQRNPALQEQMVNEGLLEAQPDSQQIDELCEAINLGDLELYHASA